MFWGIHSKKSLRRLDWQDRRKISIDVSTWFNFFWVNTWFFKAETTNIQASCFRFQRKMMKSNMTSCQVELYPQFVELRHVKMYSIYTGMYAYTQKDTRYNYTVFIRVSHAVQSHTEHLSFDVAVRKCSLRCGVLSQDLGDQISNLTEQSFHQLDN